MENIFERTLLDRLSNDDEQALQQIFEAYYPYVMSFMLRNSKAREDAEDLSQEVFLKLWNNRYNATSIESLKAYLLTICRNTLIDYYRKRVNQIIVERINDNLLHLDRQHDLDDDEKEILDTIYAMALQMPAKRLEVFQLRWINGLSRKKIAEQMGISVVTVDIHIRKAIEFLKGKVQSNGAVGAAFTLLYLLSIWIDD